MNTLHRASTNEKLRQQPLWRLLASPHAPVSLALLQTHLFEKERRLSSSVLHDRLGRDLEQLREQGWDLPQTVQAYVSQWLAAGILERSFQQDVTEEEYELSAAAVRAIRFIDSLTEKHNVATESRLAMVIQQLELLAEQTDTNPQSRIDNLLRERDRIDAEIEAIRGGRMQTLSDEQALERVREIIALSDDLANDFRQVRDEFQQLNRQLRESVVESEGGRGEVLEALFSGVDVIAESEAGRTFRAFWRLLTDPEQSAGLEASLDQLFSREFSNKLERHERIFLLRLTRRLLDQGGDVHEVLQNFARGLKQFVQSREYQQQRRLSQLLKEAQKQALNLKEHIKATTDVGIPLTLTSSRIRSLSQYQLHDPIVDDLDGVISPAEAAEISLESVSELVAQSEIDFRGLQEHIDFCLQIHEQISIADILQNFPAEQGLGSIVGYIAIGVRHGMKTEMSETVTWQGKDGVKRSAKIPRIYFLRERRKA